MKNHQFPPAARLEGSFDPFDLTLFSKDNLAGSVAREIRRIELSPADGISEGAAYKAAWDRKGSGWQKHCDAARADCDVMWRWEKVRAIARAHLPSKLFVEKVSYV